MADSNVKGEKHKSEDEIALNPNNQFLNQQPASPQKRANSIYINLQF